MLPVFRRKIILAALLMLEACAPPPPSQPVAAPPVNLSDRERAARDVHVDPAQAASLISEYRDAHGLSAVTPDPVLQGLAQAQADFDGRAQHPQPHDQWHAQRAV